MSIYAVGEEYRIMEGGGEGVVRARKKKIKDEGEKPAKCDLSQRGLAHGGVVCKAANSARSKSDSDSDSDSDTTSTLIFCHPSYNSL